MPWLAIALFPCFVLLFLAMSFAGVVWRSA
jgi:hypothetical protein